MLFGLPLRPSREACEVCPRVCVYFILGGGLRWVKAGKFHLRDSSTVYSSRLYGAPEGARPPSRERHLSFLDSTTASGGSIFL